MPTRRFPACDSTCDSTLRRGTGLANGRRRHWLAAAAACAGASALGVQAQSGNPITLVVGYPAGGATDMLARLVAEGMHEQLGESVVVENRAGANGRIGVEYVKNARADGRTLLFTNSSPIVVYQHIYRKLAYAPLQDFVPVAIGGRTMLSLAVGPSVPASVNTLPDYVAWIKAGGAQNAAYGAVPGTGPHFAGALFARDAHLDLRLIPYKGGAQAITDLFGGHVPAVFSVLTEALPHYRTGKLRILAVMSQKRSSAVPQVPAIGELGYKDIDFQNWVGMLAPAATPPATVMRLHNAALAAVKMPKAVQGIAQLAFEPAESATPSGFAAIIRADDALYARAVALTGFKIDE